MAKLKCLICRKKKNILKCCNESMVLKDELLCCCNDRCHYQNIPECCGQTMIYI
ncbi:MAG: hypothetical protein JW891_09740 [Candidatus Lokiarchaeota archaeon]|nr:hypothetical protein [Candidatus Lokiarchaeota archaeon]